MPNEIKQPRTEKKRELLEDFYLILRELNTMVKPLAVLELSDNKKSKVDARRIERVVRNQLKRFVKEKIDTI